METTNSNDGNLIQHEHVAQTTSRPKITIGPKSDQTQASVRVNRNGKRVESIEVQCGCGETILIQCDY